MAEFVAVVEGGDISFNGSPALDGIISIEVEGPQDQYAYRVLSVEEGMRVLRCLRAAMRQADPNLDIGF